MVVPDVFFSKTQHDVADLAYHAPPGWNRWQGAPIPETGGLDLAPYKDHYRGMRKAKTHSGGDPDLTEWLPMIDEIQADGATWRVWAKPVNAGGWTMVKVSAVGEVQRKANYWTAWNGQKWAASRDLQAMIEHRPALHAALLALPAFAPTPPPR